MEGPGSPGLPCKDGVSPRQAGPPSRWPENEANQGSRDGAEQVQGADRQRRSLQSREPQIQS